uniref:Peroxisomal membrane protein 4 n=1 Tax=Aplanochytrium stocchinoi TaxID=215587 RepID=A0A7S3LJD0_9STRA|mmetsp:Transcript_6259/g.7874  ORF Transcript_6259/g.7874 Transcript_6259/m.7874 type:complete len:172 (-) Transcript_6259:221-736(-)
MSLIFFGYSAHGWIIARICVIFKLTEQALMKLENKRKPEEWHTFFAGALAGYLIMYRDNSYASMKKQINMAIGIRTLYALMSYLVRTKRIPFIDNTPDGYATGTGIASTLMWGVVMWHWRHQTAPAPNEMNLAQVKQMNFIYNDFDFTKGWTDSTHLYWLAALIALRNVLQ